VSELPALTDSSFTNVADLWKFPWPAQARHRHVPCGPWSEDDAVASVGMEW